MGGQEQRSARKRKPSCLAEQFPLLPMEFPKDAIKGHNGKVQAGSV